ncbi:hypothetical protein ILUMI_07240 [Ignelater luminosus]|uniref:Uncharacterized protein n=1 Tax=Ignelater luminosus TaxID=2038154 RepID=A0A8K0GH17_IGNLU|nr:hypothetical protein ILUMI_07240 [Ignelater luminosus]
MLPDPLRLEQHKQKRIKQTIIDYLGRVNDIKRATLQNHVNRILEKIPKEQYLRQHLQNDSGNENDMADDSSMQYSSKYTNRQMFSMAEEAENIAELTNQVNLRAFITNNIFNGFKIPGIWSFGRLAFRDEDSSSTHVTDRSLSEMKHQEVENDKQEKTPKIRRSGHFRVYFDSPEKDKLNEMERVKEDKRNKCPKQDCLITM